VASEGGSIIDMGLNPAVSVNAKKKQRKEMLKNIESDVKQFMQDFEEQKQAASAFDDVASSVSGISGASSAIEGKIYDQISDAFTSGNKKTRTELLLWQKQ